MTRARLLVCLGLVTLAGAWLGPLPHLARQAFAAHMAMHMMVVAIAAPLLAGGLALSPWNPVSRWPGLFPAVPLSLAELLAVWAWHTPGLHEAARQHLVMLAAEQATFLLAGLLVWLAALGGSRHPHADRGRAGAGVAALLLTSMHMTLLGALLALSPRPLFEHAEQCTVLSPLEDQHLGGAIMLAIGGLVYLAGGLALTVPLLRAPSVPREVNP